MTQAVAPEISLKHAVINKLKELGIESLVANYSQSHGDSWEVYQLSVKTPSGEDFDLTDAMTVSFIGLEGKVENMTFEYAVDELVKELMDAYKDLDDDTSGSGELGINLKTMVISNGFSTSVMEAECAYDYEGEIREWVANDDDAIAQSGLENINLLTL